MDLVHCSRAFRYNKKSNTSKGHQHDGVRGEGRVVDRRRFRLTLGLTWGPLEKFAITSTRKTNPSSISTSR